MGTRNGMKVNAFQNQRNNMSLDAPRGGGKIVLTMAGHMCRHAVQV